MDKVHQVESLAPTVDHQATSTRMEVQWVVQVELVPFQVLVAEELQDYKRILEEATVWALEHNLINIQVEALVEEESEALILTAYNPQISTKRIAKVFKEASDPLEAVWCRATEGQAEVVTSSYLPCRTKWQWEE